ncbi:MAG: B12-binding domain-containing radical SAM protein [Deltaproteobacteria bacterium]
MAHFLLVQLPPPRFSFEEPPSNIPLAAGFLMSALAASTAHGIFSSVLEPEIVDVFADEALCRNIADTRPTVVGLTLYVWNVQRSLFLASNLKRRAPESLIIVGGPEVTPDNTWVIEHPAVDAGIFGEGESRIARLLEALLSGREAQDIEGTFFKARGSLRMNTTLADPWNLDGCPYPYLDGRIGPSRDGSLFIETVRGCAFTCNYCYYHKTFQGIRSHPRQSVEAVLDLAYGAHSGVREIYLMDPTFNAQAGYRKLLASMARRRRTKDVAAHAELRADFLSRDDVRQFKEAGLRSAEVGLQTTNRAALRAAGRSGDPEKVARGVSFLKEVGIEVTTDVILGLPEDSPQGFARTLNWLRKTDAYSVVHPFVLSVLPGTDFRARSSHLGLRPPYYVESTPTFPGEEFRQALLECEEIFSMELDYIVPPSLVDRGPAVMTQVDMTPYVSKWIVDPRPRGRWRDTVSQVVRRASDPFVLWFRNNYSEESMLRMLSLFVSSNPHAVLSVILEFLEPPRLSFLRESLEIAGDPGLFLNRSYAPLHGENTVVSPDLTIILPDPGDPAERDRVTEKYDEVARIVWDLGEPPKPNGSEIALPLVISKSLHKIADQWTELFRVLERACGDHTEEVRFRDAALQTRWNEHTRALDPSRRLPEKILLDL